MFKNFTDAARHVMTLANEEAHGFHHSYVGTEHILLALVSADSALAEGVFMAIGMDRHNISAEIEKLVQRGPAPAPSGNLPLTPRVKLVIEYALEVARRLEYDRIEPEHLLLGLLRVEDGVAAQVLHNLGVKPDEIRDEVFRVRMLQLTIVERAVRPVRASVGHKRKLREELLAHLTAIYEQELARLNDPMAAISAAGRRFGDPAELARELEISLPKHERVNYYIERWFLWRAPESAARYCWRMAMNTFCLLAVILGAVATGVFLRYGWIDGVQTLVRVFATLLLLVPVAQFAFWLLYIKLRDALWGAFGSRQSYFNVALLATMIGLLVMTTLVTLRGLVQWDVAKLGESLPLDVTIAIGTTLACVGYARFVGLTEIHDTLWALLDIDRTASGDANPPSPGQSTVKTA